MKKILLPVLFLAMFSSLSSRGFQFYNKTGRRVRLNIEARKFDGKLEKWSIKLDDAQVYNRDDFEEIENCKARTMKLRKGFFGGEVKTDKIHRRNWKRNVRCRRGRTRRMKFSIKNDKLIYRTSWIKDPE